MAEADTGTVYVGYLAVEFQLFFAAQVLRRERFVDLNLFEIVYFQARFVQKVAHRRHGAKTHYGRMAGAAAHGGNPRQRFNAKLLGFFRRHDDHRAGAVVNTGGVTGGHFADFRHESGRQFFQIIHGQLRTEMFILVKNYGWFPFFLRYFHRHDFIFKISFQRGALRVVMAAQRHFIHLFTDDIEKFCDKLRR